MIITVASGKGGTGKTTVVVSLALALATDEYTYKPVLLDCDVEEPNAALFLQPEIDAQIECGLPVPKIDPEKCTYCGRCAEVCEFSAIVIMPAKSMVFEELCHGCGSCTLVCPEKAIHEELRVLGSIERGKSRGVEYAGGRMNVGEVMAVPVISQLKQLAVPDDHKDRVVLLDSPPGTSCPVVETMRGSDFVLLVTEPTPFGLHDLRMAVEVARGELHLPVGVIINRDGVGDDGVEKYCHAEQVPILLRIPLLREVAEAYSDGIPLLESWAGAQQHFLELYQNILTLCAEYKDGPR